MCQQSFHLRLFFFQKATSKFNYQLLQVRLVTLSVCMEHLGFDRKDTAADRLCGSLLLAVVDFLKPTGHVMHQQFNIQQLYVLPTLYLCVLYLSENKQRLVPLIS